jgi:predicted SnoaL-like aldol condensation-catalyzing enzyme
MKRMQFGVLLIALLLLFSCAQVDNTAATNKELADRLTNEVFNNGNLDALDDFVAEDFVRHNPPSTDPPLIEGRDAMKEYVAGLHSTYPDFHVEVGFRLAEGDLVAASWTVTGTHAESGVAVEIPGLTISRCQDGKVAEEWLSWDTLGLENQLPDDADMEGEN